MKYLGTTLLLFTTSLFLSGCASTPNEQEENLGKIVSVPTGLPPQKLDPGECGLFIWTTNQSRKFIGFETSNEAKLFLEGQTLAASRIEQGPLNANYRQYRLPDGQAVPLTLERGEDLKDGESFSGQIITKTQDGWDRVTPVVALSSCVP